MQTRLFGANAMAPNRLVDSDSEDNMEATIMQDGTAESVAEQQARWADLSFGSSLGSFCLGFGEQEHVAAACDGATAMLPGKSVEKGSEGCQNDLATTAVQGDFAEQERRARWADLSSGSSVSFCGFCATVPHKSQNMNSKDRQDDTEVIVVQDLPNGTPFVQDGMAESEMEQMFVVSQTASIEQDEREGTGNTGNTTVMLRHIPQYYTLEMLEQLLDEAGYNGWYDFIYLPLKFTQGTPLGFAFINLVNHETANYFWQDFTYTRRFLPNEKNPEAVDWATAEAQGLEKLIERYRNTDIMHWKVPERFRPVLYAAGTRVGFPPPTKRISPPKNFKAKGAAR